MVSGSAAVTPAGSETMEAGSDLVPRGTGGLVSVQSDPALLSRPKTFKHRRHNSMFTVFSTDSLQPKTSDGDDGAPSKTSAIRNIIPSSRLKWDWKLGDLWHSRGNNKPSDTPPQVDLVPAVAIATNTTISDSIADHLTRTVSQASLHYTSLGIFESSKYSSSDSEASGKSSSEGSGSSRVPLATRWREIQGAHDWENLLDPLDPLLRAEILRYGDFAQMAYDNFEDQSWSKYAGSAKFSKKNVFEKLYKADMGYQVTRYLYATCENPLPWILRSSRSADKWDVESNWMGFVAVAVEEAEIARLGRRDIVVSWRGTSRAMEWLVDAQIQLAPMTVAPDGSNAQSLKPSVLKPKVEKGFWSLYTCKRSESQFNRRSASEQVMRELKRLLTLYKGENLSITLTGHSLGGALALLTAYEIAETGLNKQASNTTIPVTVFSFGSPRVGDAIFKRRFEGLDLKALRVVNVHDVVPKAIGGLHPPWSEAYKHVGVELQVNSKLSTYLKPSRDPVVWHNLECYLHHVDGFQGLKMKAKEFRLVTGRDVALVNKYSDALKSEFCVPGCWWQSENKGLLLNDEGRWVAPDRALEDMPSLENRDNFI